MKKMKRMKKEYYFYVGSYTEPGQKGLYLFCFDPLRKEIRKCGQYVNHMDCPAFLICDKNKGIVYAAGDAVCGSVGIYRADRSTGALEFVKQEMTDGSYTCHIERDREDKLLFAANYGGQSLSVFELEDGGITMRKDQDYIFKDCSIHPRQAEAHPHFTAVTPDGSRVCVMNLGGDCMEVFRIDGKKLFAEDSGKVYFKRGYGPRHILFHPNGRFAYATCELASQAVALKYDEAVHRFEVIQYKTTLLENVENLTSTLCIAPDGRHLYVGNRGEDTIAVFEVDPDTGRLTHKYHVAAGGRWPRELKMDSQGNYLFVMNQMSDVVSVFGIDPSGMPVPCAEYRGITRPACAAFAGEGEGDDK